MDLITQYVFKTSLMAQIILTTLLILSIISWAIILEKTFLFHRIKRQSKRFLNLFHHCNSVQDITENRDILALSPYFRLFENINEEMDRPEKMNAANSGLLADNIVAAETENKVNTIMERTMTEEIARLDQHMVFLATTVSVSPFLGLFGTVWGIMYAFMGMGMKGSADITTVGPGIAEALITTLVGLAVAIPALFAYNIFIGSLRRIDRDLNLFSVDLPQQIISKK
ncbi:MAG: MotA/TolQ/ExbB proton channel family protein [Candidatus Marinimicrobia bacterium]|nr:MotA/TolQ/ExbB proton channel family protein [Candidatus Neomarinimicrobiota bacterium]